MANPLPALTAKELLKLLTDDGWVECGKRTHGVALRKKFEDKTRITIIPTKHNNSSIPIGTLKAILGEKQTNIGLHGLRELLYGAKSKKKKT